jgi:hypothetical protein
LRVIHGIDVAGKLLHIAANSRGHILLSKHQKLDIYRSIYMLQKAFSDVFMMNINIRKSKIQKWARSGCFLLLHLSLHSLLMTHACVESFGPIVLPRGARNLLLMLIGQVMREQPSRGNDRRSMAHAQLSTRPDYRYGVSRCNVTWLVI